MADEQTVTGKRVKREDPPPRPVEGIANRGFLEQHDPTKHYVWVSEVNDPTINPAYYKSLGYQVAQFDPSEARPTLGWVDDIKQGDPIRSMGMLLMECPLERKAALDRDGWEKADRIEETIRNREVDPLSVEERRAFKGITSVRMDQDDRKRWQF